MKKGILDDMIILGIPSMIIMKEDILVVMDLFRGITHMVGFLNILPLLGDGSDRAITINK